MTVPAGAAPAGASLAVSELTASTNPFLKLDKAASALAVPAADGVHVSLGGRQPLAPVTITFTVPPPRNQASTAAVFSTSDDGSSPALLPATYDKAAHTLTVITPHLSDFFPQWMDPAPFFTGLRDTLTQLWDLRTSRPACAGQPVTLPNGGRVTLPATYSQGGDGIVWPCLAVTNGALTLTLTSNSGLPYRIRATGDPDITQSGTLDLARAAQLAIYDTLFKVPAFSETLLVPTTSMTMSWPLTKLPTQVALKADAITHLAFIGAAAIQNVLSVIGGPEVKAALDAFDAVSCLVAAVVTVAPNPDARGATAISAERAAKLLKAVLACFSPLSKELVNTVLSTTVGVLIAIITTGISAFVSSLEGIWRTLTRTDETGFVLSTGRGTVPVTHADLLSVPVPVLRGASGRLVNGVLPRTDGGSTELVTTGGGAPAIGDLTGDGVADAAAVIGATSGVGGGDEYVELYTNKDHLLGGFDPTSVDPSPMHAQVLAMIIRDGDVLLDWVVYNVDGKADYFSAHLHWDGHRVMLTNLLPHTGVTDSGLWTDPEIIISPTALGAVRIGMTFQQAQDAAGLGFDEQGDDGYSYPTDLPPASGHLYVGGAQNYPVSCVGAEASQSVSTPEGVRIGDSVQKLIDTYGSRARFVPAPTQGGLTDYAGYVVTTEAGKLAFMLDQTNSTITGIAAGGSNLDPNSCTG